MKKNCSYHHSNQVYTFLVVLFILVATNLAISQGPSDINNWSLIWSDEFNDGTINTSMWKVEAEYDAWGANPAIVSIDDNVTETGGNLVLQHKVENYSCIPPHGQTGDTYHCVAQAQTGQPYIRTGAYVWSKPSYNFTYGYIESRIKMEFTSKVAMAFWTFIGDGITNNETACEIDIFEMLTHKTGYTPDEMASNLHYQFESAPLCFCDGQWHYEQDPCCTSETHDIGNWDDVYRIWGLEWNPDEIIWYVDGIEIRRFKTHQIHEPVKLIYDVMLWDGYVSNTTPQ